MPALHTVSFRPLVVADASIVAAFIGQCRDYFLLVDGQLPSLPEIHHALSEDGPTGKRNEFWFWGMFDQSSQLLGTIQAAHHYPGYPSAHIGQLLIGSDYRGEGLGRQFYEWFETQSRQAGLSRMLLSVVKANQNALAFWQRLGFTIIGELPSHSFGLKEHERWELQRSIT